MSQRRGVGRNANLHIAQQDRGHINSPETSRTAAAGQPSSSRGSANASTSQQSNASSADEAVDVVRAILIADQSKVPFKRVDLSKMIDSKKISDETFDITKRHLRKVFGYKVVEIPDNLGQFILIRNNTTARPKLVARPTDFHDGLLTMTLGFIFMSVQDKFIELETVIDFFQRLNIERDTSVFNGIHEVPFIELVKRDWIQQLYLTADRSRGQIKPDRKDDVKVKWGPRAHYEFSQMDMLTCMAKIMDSTPNDWVEQLTYLKNKYGNITDVPVVNLEEPVADQQREQHTSQRHLRSSRS